MFSTHHRNWDWTGIVFDGKIYHGRTGSAGEGGHVSIDYRGPICRCGKARLY